MSLKKVSHKADLLLHGTKNIVSYKTCCTCGLNKSVDEYHKNSSKKDGLQADCKGCANKKRKQRYVKKKVPSKGYESSISLTLDSEKMFSFADVFAEGIKGLIENGELE